LPLLKLIAHKASELLARMVFFPRAIFTLCLDFSCRRKNLYSFIEEFQASKAGGEEFRELKNPFYESTCKSKDNF
jgi:hypothetical protein